MFAAVKSAGSTGSCIVLPIRSSVRRVVTLVLFATLMFSRLAFAFYACPTMQVPAMAMVQMNGTNCPGLVDHSKAVDEMQPALCAQYCAGEPQITSSTVEPQVSEPVLWLAYPPASHSRALDAIEPAWLHLATAATSFSPGGGGDALFLRTRRLRV